MDKGLHLLGKADERPGAPWREQFQQERISYSTVENYGGPYPGFDCIQRGVDLGNHAAENGAIFDQFFHLKQRMEQIWDIKKADTGAGMFAPEYPREGSMLHYFTARRLSMP